MLLRVVLAYLAQGESVAMIMEEFPSLTEAHLRACIAFAAASAAEDLPEVLEQEAKEKDEPV